MSMNIKIIVSAHKQYIMPQDKDVYLPIQVGYDEVKEHFGFQGDNTGDNISYKHKYYSDLSAVYWAWKNVDADYIGFCHYRRYFVSNKVKSQENPFFKNILDKQELEEILSNESVVVARKRYYFIETVEEHYKHTHTDSDFDLLRESVNEIAPEYLLHFEKVARSRSAHMFNTFIMKKDFLNSYCSFVFPILFDVESKIDFSNRTEFESRTCGYLAEFLLDTWLLKNNITYKEIKVKTLDGNRTLKKMISMLISKLLNKKYEKSF